MKKLLAAAVFAYAAAAPGFGAFPESAGFSGFAQAAQAPEEKLSLKLDGGLSVTLSRVAPPTAEVFAGAPAYALWTREGFADPVRFRLASNHAAFVRNWRLAVYRGGDLERRRPVWSVSGRGVSYAEPQIWDGLAAPGVPRLRPGEELFYVFEATDRLGRVAASDPTPLLVARYVMPQQARMLKSLAQATPLTERPEMGVGRAYGLKLVVEGLKEGETLRVDGLLISANAAGAAEFTQILPAGRYAPKIELTRARGRMAQGSLAVVLGDEAGAREARPLWGAGGGAVGLTAAAPAPTRRAHYELADQTMIYLPDTDVARDSLRAVITVDGETAAALSAGEHYVLDSLQGRLALTSAGRDLMDGVAQGLEESGQKGLLEIGYRPLAELAPPAAPGEDSAAPAVASSGDGANFVVTYGDALGPEILIAAAEALIAETIAEAGPETIAESASPESASKEAAPILTAQAEPASEAAPARPSHPLESPPPRAKPTSTAAKPAPAILVAAAPKAAPKASPQAPGAAPADTPFDDPAFFALENGLAAGSGVSLRLAMEAAPAAKTAAAPAASGESLVAQGLFIAASAPAGFESPIWSEAARPRAEAPPRPRGAQEAAQPPRDSNLASVLTQGFILDRD